MHQPVSKYAHLPFTSITSIASSRDELILKLANIALDKIIPELEQIDPDFKLANLFYYVENEITTVFKF